jgi:hypothetical protein
MQFAADVGDRGCRVRRGTPPGPPGLTPETMSHSGVKLLEEANIQDKLSSKPERIGFLELDMNDRKRDSLDRNEGGRCLDVRS